MPEGSGNGVRGRTTWQDWSLKTIKLGSVSGLAMALSGSPAAAADFISGTLAAINPDTMVMFGALGGMCAFAVTAAIALVRHRAQSGQLTEALEQEKRDLKSASIALKPC
ncbi:hypothetical protein [Roseibium alexandrii]|uniref:hypothetical protein n=1 Tax=Roseibium alexandrii TaxID=388408 RepID=UPI00375091C9